MKYCLYFNFSSGIEKRGQEVKESTIQESADHFLLDSTPGDKLWNERRHAL